MNWVYTAIINAGWKNLLLMSLPCTITTVEAKNNGDAHLKRQIMGREVVVAITNGRLDFGPWEQIFYGEFDGMRCKKVLIKIIGG
jgi:secondary thiamine-phosphate synthase enzyme